MFLSSACQSKTAGWPDVRVTIPI